MIPAYSTKTFQDIFVDVNAFKEFYNDNGIPTTIKIENVTTLYYLLYARYGNSPIANNDVNQFKYKVASIIFQFGPTWEKKLSIQKTLREMNEEEMLWGSKQIFNHSYNPSTEPSTSTREELLTINEQNATNYKRAKLDAYGMLMDLLREDVTGLFISKFSVLFKSFVRHENPILYITEGEEEDE